jgi:two-component system chemotaxis response regulator CheB
MALPTLHRDLIVVGASLGGLEVLPRFVAGLPADLEASVLIVMHMSANSAGYLPSILQNATSWPTHAALDGEALQRGHIYVAIPDHHLMVEGDRLRVTRGPRESHARPSVDVLFRSAAYYQGPRAIGIVLTGLLDDGTAGLWAIKDRGGVAIVQSPSEARYPSMPKSALQHVAVDHVLRVDEMSECLRALTREPLPGEEATAMSDEKLETEVRIALADNAVKRSVFRLGKPSQYTCPECHGSMVRIHEGSLDRFRCHTGHGFSARALADNGSTQVEKTLWAALAQLEEHQLILRELAQTAEGQESEAAMYSRRLADLEKVQHRLRELAMDPALCHAPEGDAPASGTRASLSGTASRS